LWKIFESEFLHIQRPPLVLGLAIPPPLKPIVMWKKLISQDGQWLILEHRTWGKEGPKVEKIFVSVNDSDYEQALAFCEEKGL
jgi:hypothetical protein